MGALLFAWRIRQITAAPAFWGTEEKTAPAFRRTGLFREQSGSGFLAWRIRKNRMNGKCSDGDRLENNKRKQRKGDIS